MLYKSLLKLTAVFCLPFITMTSCSSDDDDVNFPSGKTCKIVSVVSKFGGGSSNDGYTLSQFSYDSEGRIITYQEDDKHSVHPTEYEFEYGSSLILQKMDFGVSRWEVKYYLKNGLVSTVDDDDNYEYDSSNQLIGIKTYTGSDHYTKFYWSNGDIVKWEGYTDGELDYEATCTYSEYPNTLSLLYWADSDYYELPEALYAAGYFGKVSKHLPLKISEKWSWEADNNVTTFSYSEFNNEGYPSRVNISTEYTNSTWNSKDQFDLTWN